MENNIIPFFTGVSKITGGAGFLPPTVAPETRPSHKKGAVFQPRVFRGYVGFREGSYRP